MSEKQFMINLIYLCEMTIPAFVDSVDEMLNSDECKTRVSNIVRKFGNVIFETPIRRDEIIFAICFLLTQILFAVKSQIEGEIKDVLAETRFISNRGIS